MLFADKEFYLLLSCKDCDRKVLGQSFFEGSKMIPSTGQYSSRCDYAFVSSTDKLILLYLSIQGWIGSTFV